MHTRMKSHKKLCAIFERFDLSGSEHKQIRLSTNLVDSEQETVIDFLFIATPVNSSKLVAHADVVVLLFALCLNQIVKVAQFLNVLFLFRFEAKESNNHEHDSQTDHEASANHDN